jgi:kinesin family protein 6/9
MAYGQTGAGKTFTMTGSASSYAQRGLVPRAVSDLYARLAAKHGTVGVVRVSYAEIYNESFIDLLRPVTESSDMCVMDDAASGGVVVKGLSQHQALSEEEALALLFEAGAYTRSHFRST